MWEQTAGSPPRATHSALGARRCAPRALRACVPGRPGRRSVPLAAIAASRYALGADGAWALRARAPIRQPGRGLALRARRRWRRRCIGAARPSAYMCSPPITRARRCLLVVGRSKTSCALRRSRRLCKARFTLLPRGRVGRGVSDIIMHERAGQRLRAYGPQHVQCESARLGSAPPPHMTENLVHPPVLQYRAISRNIRLFWHALGVIYAWVPLGLAGGVVRGVNGGRRARSRPNLAKFQNLRTPSGVDEL